MNILLILFSFNIWVFCSADDGVRIIGGDTGAFSSFPHLAAIFKNTHDGTYFCGGSLINQRWVLTAGQCVDGATLFTIYLGTNNIRNLSSTVLKLATEEYILHPEFDSITLENDIGLIKLRMDITYTAYISSVSLARFDITPSQPSTGRIAAFGWGQTSDESAELEDFLRHVDLTVLSNEECKLTYGDQIKETMVCMAGNYNEGICHGDVGGPLIHSTRTSTTQHAVASFVSGNGCESTDPSGFTRIYPYLNWISNVTSTTK